MSTPCENSLNPENSPPLSATSVSPESAKCGAPVRNTGTPASTRRSKTVLCGCHDLGLGSPFHASKFTSLPVLGLLTLYPAILVAPGPRPVPNIAIEVTVVVGNPAEII